MSNRALGDQDPATIGEPIDGAELTAQISAISILNEPLRRALYAYVLSRTGAVGRDEAGKAVGITRELAAYWKVLEPVFEWTAEQRRVFLAEAGPAMVKYGLAIEGELG